MSNQNNQIKTSAIPVGVVGLGLMGCSITTCLLIAGHPVVAVAPISSDLMHADRRIREHLTKSQENGLVANDPEHYLKNLLITEDYSSHGNSQLLIECTSENKETYRKHVVLGIR